MNLREFLSASDARGWLRRIRKEVNPHLETAQLIHALAEVPTVFHAVQGWGGSVVAGTCSRRRQWALALGVAEQDLLVTMLKALRHPTAPDVVATAPCQETVLEDVTDLVLPQLGRLPILTHWAADGGPYVTGGVAVIRDPELGRNLAFHRLMYLGGHTFTARLVESRGTHVAWKRAGGRLPMAVCIGAPVAVQIAAAMSPAPGVDELSIANTLRRTPTVRAIGLDLEIPAESEIVLEGHLTPELGPEGPFVDLAGTRDFVRQQPFFIVERITHRQEPIYQALLPGGDEHKLLMGLPREPTIYDAVSQVCECLNVAVSPGGGCWLHAVVQIRKRSADDGLAAIEAAFRGHSSLKHVVVVEQDVDLYDSQQVEWAIATRFQADRGLFVYRDQPGSSLDPSATHAPGQKARTSKVGLDATIAWDTSSGSSRLAEYQRVPYESLNLERYLGPGGQ